MTKQELASRIWSMANKIRSKIKANEYKDYILGFMFYKFLSDKELDFLKSQGFTDEEIENMDEDIIDYLKDNIGYGITYNHLFSTWKAKGVTLDVKTVSEGLDAFNKNVNPTQKSVFENIFNTLQNGIDKLGDSAGSRGKACRDIIDMIDSIPTGETQGYDVLGYVYEFLIYKFSTAAKDDGAFYTPHEVSNLISMIVAESCKNFDELNIYDPTSGSGSLLLNIGEEASKYIDKDRIKYYGQEKITETYHLTRMNLIMKGVPSQNITVRNGDTLEDDWPYFDENTAYKPLRVNAVVSNPPYSLHWEPENRANDDRFKKYGLAPSSKADYAFLLHCLYHLEPEGTMAIVLPHGVLFRGDSEYEIRKNLCVEHNIETIIGLPANLFFATGIPTIIMILRKNRKSDDILFIDASQNYAKDKNQNVLRDCDIKRIFDAVVERKDIDNFARLVSFDEIKSNDFNLNIPRYISAGVEDDNIDFAALMNGTIPNEELDKYKNFWNEFKSLREELFTDLGNGYSEFKRNTDIKTIIETNADVLSFIESFNVRVGEFKDFLINTLIRDDYNVHVKDLKEIVSQKLFETVAGISIIDKYDVYQLLMNNWPTIEVDLGLLASDKELCRKVEPKMVTKKINKIDTDVQDGWKGAIVSFDTVGNTYLGEEYAHLKNLENEIASLESDISDVFEGLEDDVKITVGDGERFKESELKKYIKNNTDSSDIDDLNRVLSNMVEIKAKNKEIKTFGVEIIEKIKAKIETLTDDEINEMLIAKWIEPLCKEIKGITNKTVSDLIKHMTELETKYGTTLSQINEEMDATTKELCNLIDDLVGSDIDMQALQLLKEVL